MRKNGLSYGLTYEENVETAKLYLRRAYLYLEKGQEPPRSIAPLNCDAMEIAIEALKKEGWKPT